MKMPPRSAAEKEKIMASTKKTDDAVVIKMEKIEEKTVRLRIVGDTPLIMHCWSEKSKKQMLDAMTGASKGKKKEPKRPVVEFINSMNWLSHKPDLPDDCTDEEAEKQKRMTVQTYIQAKRDREQWLDEEADSK